VSSAVPAVVGLDVGTTGAKAVVFDPDGAALGYGYREYPVLCDEPAKAEQDPEAVWAASLAVLREAVSTSGIRQAAAIGVSVQGDAIIATDGRFSPVHPAILGMDYRSAPEAAWCDEHIGGRKLFDLTGMRPHAMNSAVKALWLMRNRPEAWRRTNRLLTYADFVLCRLGADPVIDWTMASRTMAFDLAARRWSAEVLGALGIDPVLWSRAEPSGIAVGKLSREVADAVGLEPGTVLATGGHDQACAAIGAGMVGGGLGLLSSGTADVLSTASSASLATTPLFEGYYPCYLHAKAGLYFTFALNHCGGILLRWYRDTLGGEEVRSAREAGRDPYDVMTAAMPAGPSPVMVLPHFNGSGNPSCDLSSKGAFVGLTLATTRGDIVKAILEGLSFELRINLEYLASAGVDIRELRTVGGGARSPAFLQIRADIIGRPVRTLRVREAACLGAAILAGTAAGVYASVDEGVGRTVRVAETFEPDGARAAVYRDRFAVYRDIHPGLRGLNTRL
jgi:xylulokinase